MILSNIHVEIILQLDYLFELQIMIPQNNLYLMCQVSEIWKATKT